MTPKQIAANLHGIPRQALEWLPGDGSWSLTRAPWTIVRPIMRLANRDLCERMVVGRNGAANDCRWRLTDLGLEVRAALGEQP